MQKTKKYAIISKSKKMNGVNNMRIRHKPWAKPELDACEFCVHVPSENKGKWNTVFSDNTKPLYLELGCGKGGFISQIAILHPEINFVAMDIKNEMLGLAKRNLEKAYAEAERTPDNVRIAIQNIEREYAERNIPIDNVKVLICNVERIDDVFAPEDVVDRIYINFCNPWPKKKHKKRRLTHTRQLLSYKKFLCGELWFKTDDDELFEESFEYFEEAGYEILYKTWDLHSESPYENIVTEHERMFTEEGKKIKFLIAKPLDNKDSE